RRAPARLNRQWLNACRRDRRTDASDGRVSLYFSCVLCRARRRAQTFALSLNDDHGDAADARSASPPSSGKPEGSQAFPLEPRVQGRLACIVMAEDVSSRKKPASIAGFFRLGATVSVAA